MNIKLFFPFSPSSPLWLKKIFFILIPLTIILTSCASAPVISERISPEIFAGIELQWQKYTDGIDYFHGRITSPKMEFHALRIDLTAPEIQVVVRGGGIGSTGSQTLSTKVSSFVRDNNLTVGINAVPFDVVSAKEGKVVNNIGIVISDSELISPVNPSFDALVFYRAGNSGQPGNSSRAAIVSQSQLSPESITDIQNAVGGFVQVLINGEPAQRTLTREVRHPRSAAGVSKNGDYLYLLVIDGRRRGSIGATELEIALLLRLLGSENGINLDGGGSSALGLRSPNGKVKIVNTPIHGGIPGRERAVAGCLGVK